MYCKMALNQAPQCFWKNRLSTCRPTCRPRYPYIPRMYKNLGIHCFTIVPFSLGLKTYEVRKITKLGWKLPSNCTKFHAQKNRKSECDFSNFARNFARCFVMRTHTAEQSRFYSRDFRIRSSFSARQLKRASGRTAVLYVTIPSMSHRSFTSLWSPFVRTE